MASETIHDFIPTADRSKTATPTPFTTPGNPKIGEMTSSEDEDTLDERTTAQSHPTIDLHRNNSSSMIIPRDAVVNPTPSEEYPPDDARAMSPRRTGAETDKLGDEARDNVRRHAIEQQQKLSEIADELDEAKAAHERIERQNVALQEYIGGLTQHVSQTKGLSSSSSSPSKGKK
ncbi:hypothetical protein MMC25_003146 [Agyrium rufum]|nr:hypothetical protein [Agyrium rufum]